MSTKYQILNLGDVWFENHGSVQTEEQLFLAFT